MAAKKNKITRRELLRFGLIGGGGLALAGCRVRLPGTILPTPTPLASPTPRAKPEAIVADVLDFALTSDQWPGDFGSVTMRIHEALYEGEPVYYTRTDASDEDFARQNELIWAPLLLGAEVGGVANLLYVFETDQPPVMRSIPGQDDFLSLYELIAVSGVDEGREFTSADQLEAYAAAGDITLTPSRIYVNYPVVKWPGGELEVDTDLTTYLGTGQLLAPVDTEAMTVTFKLHEGYPGDRYIITDTSAVERAPNMHIAASAASWALVERNAVDEVFVFMNGIPGPGVMGFQPAVFGSAVDSLVWSPFWNHFTLEWVREDQARILRNADEVYEAIERGELKKYNGVPDSHPDGFVVNCAIPVLADNTL